MDALFALGVIEIDTENSYPLFPIDTYLFYN